MLKNMLSKNDLEQTIGFVFSREQPEGGFSFAGMMPPTLEDTYYAIRTLKLIEKETGRKIPIKKETIEYILTTDEDNLVDYKLQYQSLWLCRQFNLEPRTRRVDSSDVLVKNFEQFYYYILLNGKTKNNTILKKSLDELNYISDLAYMVLIKNELKIKFDQQAYAQKIQSIQNHDGGFGFNEGSTSFLENTYLAVKALAALNQKPLLLNECLSLIEGSRANNGGYGRSISTVPTLEATSFAIECLQILKGKKYI